MLLSVLLEFEWWWVYTE